MAFQLTRSKAATESLELVDESGKVVDTIVIRLDQAGLAQNASRKLIELTHAQAAVKKAETERDSKDQLAEAYQHVEEAFLSVIRVICGEEDTKKLLDFYGGNVLELSNAVTPFFIQVVIPRIREMAKEARKNKMRSYDRKFFKR